MKILKAEFDKIREEVSELGASAFWMETYSLGLKERCRRLKAMMDALEEQRPEKAETTGATVA